MGGELVYKKAFVEMQVGFGVFLAVSAGKGVKIQLHVNLLLPVSMFRNIAKGSDICKFDKNICCPTEEIKIKEPATLTFR